MILLVMDRVTRRVAATTFRIPHVRRGAGVGTGSGRIRTIPRVSSNTSGGNYNNITAIIIVMIMKYYHVITI